MSVRATIVDDIDSEAGQAPGAVELRPWQDSEVVAGFGCRCPCGCGSEMWLPVRAARAARTETPEWEWDGNRKAPTLYPSVYNSGLPANGTAG